MEWKEFTYKRYLELLANSKAQLEQYSDKQDSNYKKAKKCMDAMQEELDFLFNDEFGMNYESVYEVSDSTWFCLMLMESDLELAMENLIK